MDQPVTITGKFSSIVRTIADLFKIDFAATTLFEIAIKDERMDIINDES